MNDLIDREPDTDVINKPVRHGRWRTVLFERQPRKRIIEAKVCSECGSVQIRRKTYCPSCGAKMDGDSE